MHERGITEVTIEIAIQHGLFSLASENPILSLRSVEISILVRSALFANEAKLASDEQLIEQVAERLCLSLNKHLTDDPEKFDGWFNKNSSSWIENAANRSFSPSTIHSCCSGAHGQQC